MASKKVLLIVTNVDSIPNTNKNTGYYLPEAAHAYHVFVEAGYDCVFVSPKGGLAPVDPGSVEAFKNDKICTDFLNSEAVAEQLKTTLKPSQVNASLFDAIFFVGGHGPLYDIPDNEEIQQITSKVYENGRVVGAVCHGPIGLVNVKLSSGEYLLKGKTVCAFTNEEEEAIQFTKIVPYSLEDKLKERGATFVGAQPWSANVQVTERLVTGQNPASTTGTAQAIVKLLSN